MLNPKYFDGYSQMFGLFLASSSCRSMVFAGDPQQELWENTGMFLAERIWTVFHSQWFLRGFLKEYLEPIMSNEDKAVVCS